VKDRQESAQSVQVFFARLSEHPAAGFVHEVMRMLYEVF
jgi:hypothetical protein